jgi:hypothetical protein
MCEGANGNACNGVGVWGVGKVQRLNGGEVERLKGRNVKRLKGGSVLVAGSCGEGKSGCNGISRTSHSRLNAIFLTQRRKARKETCMGPTLDR